MLLGPLRVSCPWAVEDFGLRRPPITLLVTRGCAPAAHGVAQVADAVIGIVRWAMWAGLSKPEERCLGIGKVVRLVWCPSPVIHRIFVVDVEAGNTWDSSVTGDQHCRQPSLQ